ncbi:MAG: hypothetical protein AB7O59_07775 [Pirellulales bacterium]
MNPAPRVIKLGGSLLDWPPLAETFGHWLARQSPAANVIIVGGGTLVEALRHVDRAHSLPAETTHWLAIRAMSITAALAHGLLPQTELVTSLDRLPASPSQCLCILDVEQFVRGDAHMPDALPCSWEVTSDSIAARVAVRLGAQELVLLKSTLPAGATSHAELAARGHVDACFPHAARGLRVRSVNLRDDAFPEVLVG